MLHPAKIPEGTKAFTNGFTGISRRLENDVTVESGETSITYPALWDTGASLTCISKDVVSELGLVPTGRMTVKTPSGTSEVGTYAVSLVLPNSVRIPDIMVCESEIGDQGLGVLVGMDVITMGDFAVSNKDGKTFFTFRVPSIEKTDYVREIKMRNVIGKSHGPGKGKKRK